VLIEIGTAIEIGAISECFDQEPIPIPISIPISIWRGFDHAALQNLTHLHSSGPLDL